jgi:glucose/arabinose dehydrogenase
MMRPYAGQHNVKGFKILVIGTILVTVLLATTGVVFALDSDAGVHRNDGAANSITAEGRLAAVSGGESDTAGGFNAIAGDGRNNRDTPGAATVLPEGFEETVVASELDTPTDMEFAPDGRLFVAEQEGTVRIIDNGELLPTPFLTIEDVEPLRDSGLLGLTFGLDFDTDGNVFVYYTKPGDELENVVSRFTVSADDPNIVDPSSEVVIFDDIPGNPEHNGGQIHFGPDGKLYILIGDVKSKGDVQSLESLIGKVLRINPDGSVPSDNPFVEDSDARGEIWAYGFRNPFKGDIDHVTGKMYINDVGQRGWEEINLVSEGANYGWPECEGECEDSTSENPIYAYSQSSGCAITGGAFYREVQFPEGYHGSYFFADFCAQWIKRLLPDNTVKDFVSDSAKAIVDLEVGPDGSLYYLSFSDSGSTRPKEADGAVYEIRFVNTGNQTPTAVISASPTSGIAPVEVNFDGSGSGDPDGDPLVYRWDFGDGSPPATGVTSSHTYTTNGVFDVRLIADDQKGSTDSASITILVGNPPLSSISLPEEGATFNAGETIQYLGTGTDLEDGALPSSAFSWHILLLHHPETDPRHHIHPFLGPINGFEGGSFQTPQEEHDHDIGFRIHLTVTDSDGLTHESARDIFPNLSTLTLY